MPKDCLLVVLDVVPFVSYMKITLQKLQFCIFAPLLHIIADIHVTDEQSVYITITNGWQDVAFCCICS